MVYLALILKYCHLFKDQMLNFRSIKKCVPILVIKATIKLVKGDLWFLMYIYFNHGVILLRYSKHLKKNPLCGSTKKQNTNSSVFDGKKFKMSQKDLYIVLSNEDVTFTALTALKPLCVP